MEVFQHRQYLQSPNEISVETKAKMKEQQSKITVIDAKIKAIMPFANAGTEDTQQEILHRQAARSLACEAITNMKSPT